MTYYIDAASVYASVKATKTMTDQQTAADNALAGLLLREGKHSGVWFAPKLIDAAERIKSLLADVERAEEGARAWKEVAETIEAHLQDRVAMKDEANPVRYLEIVQASIRRVERSTEQLLNSRWYDERLSRERIATLEADRQRMRDALEPFAKAAEIRLCAGDKYWTDNKSIQGTDIAFHITFGDLRTARACLNPASKEANDG